MLTILNRRELLVTLSMERQAEVRRILAENGIDYTIKTSKYAGRNAEGEYVECRI